MLQHRDLLGMKDCAAEEITEILDVAKNMKPIIDAPSKKSAHLTGKSIITLFYENSTRTRVSFETAAKYMSAAAVNISAASSSVAKGETLIDTGRTLDQMGADVVILRHPMSGAPHLLARHCRAAVINAGDGMNEHPTQALLDMYTMREQKGELKGLRVAIIGDVLHSRVARSNLWGLLKMGASVAFSAPPTLLPPEFADMGARVYYDPKEAVKGADVVMGLRIQRERQKAGLFPSVREYSAFYGIDEGLLALADKAAMVMHPGPMNRGVEISSTVADSDHSYIEEQVKNGLAVRMALLFLLTRRRAS